MQARLPGSTHEKMADFDRLSRIDTLWSVVRRAHGDNSESCKSAQQELLDRYGFAIRRYLQAALRDETAVDEVFQEFGLAFVRGDYQSASPDRGKFRSFLKTIMFRLVADYRKSLYRRETPGAEFDEQAEAAHSDVAELDEDFASVWRESLLGRAWARLESAEQDSGRPFYTVLRFRVDHPQLGSSELADELTRKLEKPISAANARVLIHRAREKFTNLLIDEIMPSLKEPTLDCLEEELIELELIGYCREALEKRRAGERD